MNITEQQRAESLVIRVEGDIDASNAAELRKHLGESIGRHTGRFVLDLSAVSFIDSSGLGALVGFYKQVRVGEGDVRLAGLQENVQKIFALTRLDQVFGLHSTVDEALEAA